MALKCVWWPLSLSRSGPGQYPHYLTLHGQYLHSLSLSLPTAETQISRLFTKRILLRSIKQYNPYSLNIPTGNNNRSIFCRQLVNDEKGKSDWVKFFNSINSIKKKIAQWVKLFLLFSRLNNAFPLINDWLTPGLKPPLFFLFV